MLDLPLMNFFGKSLNELAVLDCEIAFRRKCIEKTQILASIGPIPAFGAETY
jgi:hypothetical protein